MKFITTKTAAERLKVSMGRVRQLVLAGRLRATKIGRDLLFDPADLKSVVIRKTGRPVTR